MLLELLLAVYITAMQAQASNLQVLQEFKGNVTDPEGKLSTWIGASYCSWQGITCDGLSNVVKLDVSFPPGTLSGTLPVGLQQLAHLTEVHFEFNALSGTLPAAWSAWAGLVQFYAQSNLLTGTLPPEWSSWRNVTQINLQSNSLSGLLPASWSSMSVLTRLNLVTNKLAGSLPTAWASGMASMFRLNLDSNAQICGQVPAQWLGRVTYSSTNILQACPSPPLPPAPPPSPGSVLLSLKASIVDDPANWTGSWASHDVANQCSWLGVACSNGAVTSIEMEQFNVQVEGPGFWWRMYADLTLLTCIST